MSESATIPSSWMRCRLGEVFAYGSTTKAEPNAIAPDDWVLELEDIEKDTARLLERTTFRERQSKSTKNVFRAGDVLYGKLRPYLNKIVQADADGFCTTEIVPISTPPEVYARYLFHWLRHPEFTKYVSAVSHGLNMPRLGTEAGRQAPFILAPLTEQKRIADKLDVLLTRVDACRYRLDRGTAIVRRFRQAVLNAAVEGRLTEEWRGGGLEKWTFERASDVCEKVQSGGTPKVGFTSAGVPFLKVYNIVNQRVDFDYRSQFIADDVQAGAMSKSITLPGDVLMNIVGPPLGKVAIVTSQYPSWNINQAITLFRPSKRVSTGWLYFVLCGGKNVRSIVHDTRGSAGQVNISLSQCRNFEIPVPPVAEQAEIVRRVESLFTLADCVEASYAAARATVERLTPALLTKAFRGELVPHDPNAEPASRLLERIANARKSPVQSRMRKPPIRRTDLKTAIAPTLLEAIQQMSRPAFTFDELMQVCSVDYEPLKEELFALLADSKSGVKQYFDAKERTMKLRRVSK